MKKFYLYVIVLILVLLPIVDGCFIQQAYKVEAAQINISSKNIVMVVGSDKTLKIKGTSKKVKWSSSKKSVASVNSKGKVTALKGGKARIVASVNGKKYICKVTVKQMILKKTKTSIRIGETIKWKVSNAKRVKWSSSNKKVAKVNSKGVIVGISSGKSVITAKAGKSKVSAKIVIKKADIKDETSAVVSYTLNYDGNGANNGSVVSQKCTVGVPLYIAANSYVKDGYDFVEWNTSSDGSGTSYSAGQSVTDLTTENNGRVTLYAIWTNYTIEPFTSYIKSKSGKPLTINGGGQWIRQYSLFKNYTHIVTSVYDTESYSPKTSMELTLTTGEYELYWHTCSYKSTAKNVYREGQGFVYEISYSPSGKNSCDYSCKISVK